MALTYTAKVIALQDFSKNIRHVGIELPQDSNFDFKAGQFISIHIVNAEGKEVKRNFSIGSSPYNKAVIEFAAGFVPNGLATNLLFNLKINDQLKISGPYGILVLKEEPVEHLTLVATGTGVTPYRAMLPDLEKLMQQKSLKVSLILGVRSPKELLYGEEFKNFAKQHENFAFYAYYSREMPNNPDNSEFSGYVLQHLESNTYSTEKDLVYLCGNPNMVDMAFDILQKKGLDRKRVRREKYISGR